MIKKTSYRLVLISVYLLCFYNISGQNKVYLSDYDELFSIWDTSQYKDENNALQLRCPKIDTSTNKRDLDGFHPKQDTLCSNAWKEIY